MKASDIRAALSKSYCQPEWAIFFEVADGTGAAKSRSADAVAMNMWPSRGLELRAFEIKVSRSDLANELKDPSKAEAVGKYCDCFYLATPKGLTKGMDVPVVWGILEVADGGSLRISRHAAINEAVVPPSKSFLASLMRSAAKTREADTAALIDLERERMRVNEKKRADMEIARRLDERRRVNDAAGQMFEKMAEVMGEEDVTRYLHDADFWTAVRAVHALGLDTAWQGVGSIHRDLRRVSKAAEKLAAAVAGHAQQLSVSHTANPNADEKDVKQ